MTTHVIKRGLDLPIAGRASGAPIELPPPATVAYTPTELRGITPKPIVREGDTVKQGQPIMTDKNRPELVFRAPAAGRIAEVRRGARRVLTDLIIEVDPQGEVTQERAYSLAEIGAFSREQALAAVLASGSWGSLRSRPLNRIVNPSVVPQNILISATESGPLQPGAEVLLSAADKEAFQAGVAALKHLTDGKVFLAVGPQPHPALSGLSGVETLTFQGPHPSGDPAVQVNLACPPRGGGQVWWARAWDIADLGHFLLTGRFRGERVYAAVGTGAKAPRFVKTLLGAPLQHIVGDAREGCRWIRGSVLSGEATDPGRAASFYTRAVHVLPDEVEREFLGWITPGFGKFSFHKAFLAGFTGGSGEYDLRPGTWGGHRAIIPFGRYEDVIATPDIQPQFLFRSIIAGDLEDAIKLGLLDVSEEEAALMTYICPSKIEYDVLLREGLALYEKEA